MSRLFHWPKQKQNKNDSTSFTDIKVQSYSTRDKMAYWQRWEYFPRWLACFTYRKLQSCNINWQKQQQQNNRTTQPDNKQEKKDNRTKHLDRKLQSYNTRWQKRTTVQHTVTEKDNDSDRKRQSYNTVTRQLRQLTGSGECGFPRCLARFAETKRQSYNTHWQKRTIVQHSHESIRTAYWKRWLSLSKMSRPFRWWLCTCTPPCLTTAGLKTNRWTCHHA